MRTDVDGSREGAEPLTGLGQEDMSQGGWTDSASPKQRGFCAEGDQENPRTGR